jgi:DICT domain-containing protein
VVEDLTIGQLAERTGVQAGTLRMWEQRHGFPRARRLPSGHRRYRLAEVERVLDVLRAREAGLSLGAAIARSAQEDVPPATPSIFAGLRRLRPDLPPYPVPKRMLVPISHAIEDECSARGGGAILIGSFQHERFYRQAQARWRCFADTAELALVLGDFARRSAPDDGPVEVPISRSHPLSREWAIVCDGPGASTCMAGWERPGGSGRERIFEMLWCAEPAVVREVARLGVELAVSEWPEVAERVPGWLYEPAESDEGAVERATAITNRMLAYLTATG